MSPLLLGRKVIITADGDLLQTDLLASISFVDEGSEVERPTLLAAIERIVNAEAVASGAPKLPAIEVLDLPT